MFVILLTLLTPSIRHAARASDIDSEPSEDNNANDDDDPSLALIVCDYTSWAGPGPIS